MRGAEIVASGAAASFDKVLNCAGSEGPDEGRCVFEWGLTVEVNDDYAPVVDVLVLAEERDPEETEKHHDGN